jgi:hypothetical protein
LKVFARGFALFASGCGEELQFTAADGIGSLVTFSRFSRYPTEASGRDAGVAASTGGAAASQLSVPPA